MPHVTRLIDSFVPEHYDLQLTLEREARRFNGTVTIDGASPSGAKTIDLHAKDLEILSVTVDGQVAQFAAGDYDELHINAGQVAGESHRVVVEFAGTIADGMHGLYPCYYEHDGIKKELLVTQLESHHAREVFPCVDEPEAKATFDVTLTTELDVTVLGNMPVKSQQSTDVLITTFEQTPRMSSYLLAFVVGELHKKSAATARGVDVSVYATPAQPADSFDFALETAVRAIEFYEDYFGVDYPLPKSDHVALPDFAAGAMENWGLITYREEALLVRPKLTGISSQQQVATVITHELAHQWFGNLVTMRWWDDLWLNESFANIMEYISVDRLFPDWKIWLDYAASEPLYALRRDSIDGVQPIRTTISHPDEISTLFDPAIVYAKGGRLIRMALGYIGEAAFRKGLKAYFAAHAYGNAEGDDLWRALSQASGEDITDMMNAWITQPGFPVVHAAVDGADVTLRQERFFTSRHEPSSALWPIPLGASTGVPKLLTGEQLVAKAPARPLLLNQASQAHFISDYDDTLLGELMDQVAAGDVLPIDRLRLLSELTLLIRGGVRPSSKIIAIIQSYRDETVEQVWDSMSLALAELRKFVEHDTAAEQKLRRFCADFGRREYTRLGWQQRPDEPESDHKLRATIIAMMLYGEDADALAQARQHYEATSLEQLDPELRPLILSSVVRHGDGKLVDELVERYAHETSPDIKNDICFAATNTRNAAAMTKLLKLLSDTSVIRPQDTAHWFVYLLRSREGRVPTWQWLRREWEWVKATFRDGFSYDVFVRYAASGLVTPAQLSEFREFFEPMMSDVALSRTITMGVSEIEARIELIERDGPGVIAALKEL